ncbi:hypothetical protein HGRIS_012476 [Hohenbuehelia grisea]|uniref:Cupin type-1 domain-containing protein n=1 Tax=Hohenbuehelia grisea TaxID=104357 RepID=A0ABR3ISD7_9AGAR
MSSAGGVDLSDAPLTIEAGMEGVSMTFLRNSAWITRTEVAADADFSVPLHYHETHDEIFRVIEGRIEYTFGVSGANLKGSPNAHLSSKYEKKVFTPEDGEIVIPRGTIHGIRGIGELCIFEEKTDPMDEEKELFFRNIFAAGGMSANVFAVFQVFYYGDTIPVLPTGLRWMERSLVTFLGYHVAPKLGFKLKYDNSKAKTL